MDGNDIVLTKEDVIISSEDIPGWEVVTEDGLTVALDIVLTDELRQEGIARELVNRIQNLRKDSGLEVTDKISVTIASSDAVCDAVRVHRDYIASQVLAVSLVATVDDIPGATVTDMDGTPLQIIVKKFVG